MDIEEWNPRTDKFLDIKFDRTTVFQGKAAAKSALQVRRCVLPRCASLRLLLPLGWPLLRVGVGERCAPAAAGWRLTPRPAALPLARRPSWACPSTPRCPCLASSAAWRSRRAWTSWWRRCPRCCAPATCR
jgi:hypothetical protein